MTNKEANIILQTKYPQGYINHLNKGRYNHTNMVCVVCFKNGSKEYQYKGSYEGVLIHLGLIEVNPQNETKPTKSNIFIDAIKKENN